MLARQGFPVVTLDNLSTGHRDAVVAGTFIEGDLMNEADLARVFSAHPIEPLRLDEAGGRAPIVATAWRYLERG